MWRKAYGKLLKWKKASPRRPLVMYGARQVGKTYLLRQFGENEFSNTHYINFERNQAAKKIFEQNYDPKRIIEELSFFLDEKIDLQSDLLLLDEIQAAPKALTSLKYFCEELPELAVASAGSLLGLQLGAASFPVGKVDIISLYPMSFEEFLVATEGEQRVNVFRTIDLSSSPSPTVHDLLWSRLHRYFVIGGMPDAIQAFRKASDDAYQAMDRVREMQERLILAYFADMAKHAGKENAMHLERVWRAVVRQLGQSQDRSTAKFRFRGVVPGVSHYSRLAGAIDWLSATGLIHKIHIANYGRPPLMGYTKENRFKLALFDVGILGAIADLSPSTILDQEYGSYKGYFAENFVAQELVASGIKELYSWQERDAEVEFLINAKGEIVPLEVKSGQSTKAKSLNTFCNKYAPPYRLILSGQPLNVEEQSGVYRLPLYLAGQLRTIL